jgi:hypothetical protein
MVNQAKSLTIEEKKEIVSNYPAAENALIALIMLIKSGADVDDWECDFSEIVWPEVEKNK